MANPEHLDILKQGVETWNEWRKKMPEILPDLSHANLAKANLAHTDFSHTILTNTNFTNTILTSSDFTSARLIYANLYNAYLANTTLTNANLANANLNYTYLVNADFTKANLSDATLTHADLTDANFTQAKLKHADLTSAKFNRTKCIEVDLCRAYLTSTTLPSIDLSAANFNQTVIGETLFSNIDLSQVKGLDQVTHRGPSTIGIDTIIRSQGNIPEIFLRRAGIPDSFIEYAHSLVASPIDYYTCFLSYSSKDQKFAQRLYNDLQAMGVRCWFAPHDMKIGDRIRPRIDESIRLYDKLLLILSQHSVCSQWVEHEVETAIGKELESKPNVLFPIRLDNVVMESKTGWASHIKLTRHVGDFTDWKDYDRYQAAFNRLLRDLKAEGKETL